MTTDHRGSPRIDAAFEGSRRAWVWRIDERAPRRASWLDGYDLLGLAPNGRRLIVQDTPKRDEHLPHAQRNRGRKSQLLLADVATEQVSVLLDWSRQFILGWAAAWDPTGTRVAFHAVDVDDDDNIQVVVIDLEKGTTSRVFYGPGKFSVGERLTWSPDGRRIAFDVMGGFSQDGYPDDVNCLVVVDVASGRVVAREPEFSLWAQPGGGWTDQGLLVVNMGYGPDTQFAPFATTVRDPLNGQRHPFPDGHRNDQPLLHLHHVPEPPWTINELRWLNRDGSLGTSLCRVDDHVSNWVTSLSLLATRGPLAVP